MNPLPAQANVRELDLVARLDNTPIIAGTVSYYLQAKTGANAGKWFQTSDDSWQATEQVAGTMSHDADGHWSVSVDAAAWADGVEYVEYAKESGNLHFPVSYQIRCEYPGDVKRILATLLTETVAGYLAAGVKKLFDVATPGPTMNDIALAEKLLKYVQLLARSDAAIATDNATELTAINANGGSGAGDWSNQTDSEEAIRDTAPLGTAMRGTDGANTVVPDPAGTGAAIIAALPSEPPTADAIGTDAAGKILATPANKLATDGTGKVTYANAAPPTADAIGTDAAGKILATPANKLATDASGNVEANNAELANLDDAVSDAVSAAGAAASAAGTAALAAASAASNASTAASNAATAASAAATAASNAADAKAAAEALPSAAQNLAALVASDQFAALLSAAGYYLREVEVLTRDATTGEVLTATYTLHKANGDVLATLNYVATVDAQHRLATHEMEAE